MIYKEKHILGKINKTFREPAIQSGSILNSEISDKLSLQVLVSLPKNMNNNSSHKWLCWKLN